MTKRINSKNTKAEILSAYKELEAAYKELEAQKASQVVTSPVIPEVGVKTSESPPPSKGSKNILKGPDSPQAALMEDVIKALGQISEQFNMALSQFSTHLLVEASSLKENRITVETESNRLKNLYDLEIEEETLSQLLTQYTQTTEQYRESLKQKREEAEKMVLEKNQAWQTEKEETRQQLQEQESSDKKTQKREENEYYYDLSLKRDLTDEDYNQQKKQQQQILDEVEETQRKAWDKREKGLAEHEKQFQEYKTKVERFPKELEIALKKAKEEGAGIARHQAKIKSDLTAKEFAGEEDVYQLKIKALENQIADQTTQIDKLSKQLEVALKQAQELAVKAIEGSSSHSSFQALKEIALEQAKNQPKAK